MTTVYKKSAIYDIRKWLWAELTDVTTGILSQADYNKVVTNFNAVVPIQQIPETNSTLTTQPFIVYDYIPIERGPDYWRQREEVVFTIYCSDYSDLMEIQEFMKDVFGRMDDSARDINAYNPSSVFKFFMFEILDALPPDPAKNEDGRFGASFTVAYEYTRKSITANGKFAS